MNIDLLNKIKEQIQKESDRFDYDTWVVTRRKKSKVPTPIIKSINSAFADTANHCCGTAACVGGWALILSGEYKTLKSEHDSNMFFTEMIEKIKEVLDLNDFQFYFLCMPWLFDNAYLENPDIYYTSEEAIERIDYLISGKQLHNYRSPQLSS